MCTIEVLPPWVVQYRYFVWPMDGKQTCMKLGLIACHVSDVSSNDFCSGFKEVFQELGHVSEECQRSSCV